MNDWLNDAVFYEIYPQSFCDSNGDGIGDFRGIISKLDYIQGLGFNAIWMNPCYDSPFIDAGYDVRDYYKVAERYGTMDDIKDLFDEIHRRGMHILTDLVPGHTSDQCEWFKESAKEEKNEYTDRYIWTDSVWEDVGSIRNIMGMSRGGTERNGAYFANFFNAQPALNYGFANIDPDRPWQQAPDAVGPRATVEAIKDVMRFWLDLGCDGFRVDMAGSLIKSDPDQSANMKLWGEFRDFFDKEYPDARIISEWGEPDKSVTAGFHMDFVLHFGPSHYLDLFRVEHPYFSRKGQGNAKTFFDLYLKNLDIVRKKNGFICIPSGNHDMLRMAKTLDPEEMKIAFTFLMTMPGIPFVYYGDEIGMRYVEGLTSVEGGYERTGSRSPMAFSKGKNAGFSDACESDLYIAQDESKSFINVESELDDKDSLLNEVKELIKIRHDHKAFQSDSRIEMLELNEYSYPLAYRISNNDESMLVILNPSDRECSLGFKLPEKYEMIHKVGKIDTEKITEYIFPAASAVILKEAK